MINGCSSLSFAIAHMLMQAIHYLLIVCSKTMEMESTARRKQARRHEVGVRTQSGKLK